MPPTSKSRTESSCGIAIGGFLVVAVFGTILLFKLLAYFSSGNWVNMTAEILTIEATSKAASIEYGYSLDDTNYVSSRFAILSRGTLQHRDAILEKYEVGDELEILVNPRRPSQATVLRGSISDIKHEVVFVTFGILLLVVGSYRISSFRKKTRSRIVEAAPPQI